MITRDPGRAIIAGRAASQISFGTNAASSMISKSTGQPRICFSDAGTERIIDPFVNVNRVLPCSTIDPRNNDDADAKSTQSAKRRFAASSPADTTNTKTRDRVAASNRLIFANDRDLPTCRPATTKRNRAPHRANTA